MRIEKYEPVTTTVDAVQVTVDNMEDVAFWCDGAIKGTKLPPEDREIEIWNKVLQQEQRAEVGDWIYNKTGTFWVAKHDHFKLFYTKVKL